MDGHGVIITVSYEPAPYHEGFASVLQCATAGQADGEPGVAVDHRIAVCENRFGPVRNKPDIARTQEDVS